MHVMLDPGEGDSALSAALAEAQQKRPGTLVAQERLLTLFADEAQDTSATNNMGFNVCLCWLLYVAVMLPVKYVANVSCDT